MQEFSVKNVNVQRADSLWWEAWPSIGFYSDSQTSLEWEDGTGLQDLERSMVSLPQSSIFAPNQAESPLFLSIRSCFTGETSNSVLTFLIWYSASFSQVSMTFVFHFKSPFENFGLTHGGSEGIKGLLFLAWGLVPGHRWQTYMLIEIKVLSFLPAFLTQTAQSGNSLPHPSYTLGRAKPLCQQGSRFLPEPQLSVMWGGGVSKCLSDLGSKWVMCTVLFTWNQTYHLFLFTKTMWL